MLRPKAPLPAKTAPDARPSPSPDLAFCEVLRRRAASETLRKGQRTGLRIRAAACELLDSTTPDKLKIQDICTLSAIAQGTMYQYFSDRDHLLATLLQEFAVFLQEQMKAATLDSTTPEQSMRLATLSYCRLFEANRGLMKCLLHHYEAFPQARGILSDWNKAWIDTIVRAVAKRQRGSATQRTPEAELRRRAYALGGMVDQYLAGIYLYGDAHLTRAAGKLDAIVDTLTFIWSRAMADELAPAR